MSFSARLYEYNKIFYYINMDNTNINTENLLPKINTPKIFYFLATGIGFLIIMMFLIMYDVSLSSLFGKNAPKSQEQLTADIFAILFFSLLIFGICVLFLPNMKEFKNLFQQISGVTYVILYTIFAILFYTMMPKETLDKYPYIINSIMIFLGGLFFFKSMSEDYIDNFNLNYERIKMLILLFCFITIIITFYNVNPGNFVSNFSGSSLLITIILSVFAFLYVIILLTLPGEQGSTQKNFLNNFSSFGVYGSILFVIFLITMASIISSDKSSFFENKTKSSSVMILLLIISIVWVTLLGVNLFTGSSAQESIVVSYMKKGLLGVFGLVISALLIYWLTYNIGSLSGGSSIMSFILNILLVVIVLGLIYKTMNVNLPTGNAKKNAFFSLALNTLFYIPCLVSGGFDWLGNLLSGKQDTGSLIMLVIAICLLVVYFKMPSLFNSFSSQGGQQLVNKPVYTDTEYNLGSYQELNGGDDKFDYQYAISCWVFIDAAAPNTNPNYTKFTSLLNFGNKPNILYNSSKNTMMITMQQKDLKNITKNKLIDFDDNGNRIIYVNKNMLLQKWNNIIINYNGGTMDIFLNGELVKSSIEVVPYYTIDNLTIGENEGIKGGICNVIYFRSALTSSNIYYVYNTVKNSTPPVLNDSNETILTKDIK